MTIRENRKKMMQRTQSGLDRVSATGSRRHSSSIKTRRSISRGPSVQGSRLQAEQASLTDPQQQQQQQRQNQATSSILHRRERVRVFDEEGEDVTPKTLDHPDFSATRRTAFDAIAALATSSTALGGQPASTSPARPSLVTISSFSSVYTLDEILAAKAARQQSDSIISSARVSLRESGKTSIEPVKGPADVDSDAPSQYHLSKIESREQLQAEDRVTLTFYETETFFLFELAQLTEDASTEIGEEAIVENERYEKLRGGAGRKNLDAESQTPQVYVKSRATHIARQERKNCATYVNNWVMHDDLERHQDELSLVDQPNRRVDDAESQVKFPVNKKDEHSLGKSHQLETIGEREAYEDATRITLRILASRDYEEAQKRFAGLSRQDPCDPDLELIYGLELLWKHSSSRTRRKAVAAFRWNPVNASLLAVGYETRRSSKDDGSTVKGLVLIWCAKNPTEPDRCYEFESSVSDLDWSRTRPNLLAVGFYDGALRVIDVSKKQLCIVWQPDEKVTPSFEPHWQVQWWAADDNNSPRAEQLYTSNQDGRICCYPSNEEFAAHEILRLQRIEGKIAGVFRANNCLGSDVPLSAHPGALLLRRWPSRPENYLVGSEEGSVHKCSIAQPHTQIGAAFLAHDGPICSLEISPFCDRLILTCGADWTARVWAEGLDEPLLKFSTKMACVNAAAWSPRNSTIFAYAVENEICIWDLRRKSHRPASVTTVTSTKTVVVRLEFTRSGEQLVAADDDGAVYVYGLKGMPLPPLDQTGALVDALHKALVTKPELLKKLHKLGPPFNQS